MSGSYQFGNLRGICFPFLEPGREWFHIFGKILPHKDGRSTLLKFEWMDITTFFFYLNLPRVWKATTTHLLLIGFLTKHFRYLEWSYSPIYAVCKGYVRETLRFLLFRYLQLLVICFFDPTDPLFLKVHPPKQGRNSNHLGSRKLMQPAYYSYLDVPGS